MQLSNSFYGLLCSLSFGIGQLCLLTGYYTHSFVVESVLHSAHDRDTNRIDAHAGYYGQAIMYGFYTFANLFSPCCLNYMSSKTVLVLGSAMSTIYLAGFFFINPYFFYPSCIALGIGFALYYTGHGGYLTEHSTRETIERNSAVIWGVGTMSMIVGGVIMLFTSKASNAEVADFSYADTNNTMQTSSYREYSETEIRYLFGAFAAISLASNLIFAVLPSAHVENSLADIAEKTGERTPFREQMRLMWKALRHPRVLLLAPLFSFIGVNTSLWISVYPTSLAFTKSLSHHVYLPALYSIVLGTGDMLMSLLISVLAKPIPNFGQKPTMVMAVVLCVATYAMIFATTPPQSTRIPTDQPAMFIQPTVSTCLLIAFLFGLSDGCLMTTRTIMCAIAIPKKRNQTFAIAKFYQSLLSTIIMFASPFLSVYVYLVVLLIGLTLTAVSFFIVAEYTTNETVKMERKVALSAPQAPKPHHIHTMCSIKKLKVCSTKK